ncbi:MAG: NAD(P)-binding domain-containing protein [Planctomycetota bacterium]
MSWTVLIALVLGSVAALLVALARRHELARMAGTLAERERAEREGASKAQLQHPEIDLSRCVGCGACVDACPEDGVLAMLHGQAAVVNWARCVGVAECERVCPTAAIVVTLGNLTERDDVPAVSAELEAVGQPGLFLAGEVTAHALVKTAIEHGTRVARAVAARCSPVPAAARALEAAPRGVATPTGHARCDTGDSLDPVPDPVLDLVIVGAGPAGLACALEASRLGLRFVVLDQASGPGGTVAKYPRRKLVLTQPVDLPRFGRLDRPSYTKEELLELWEDITATHRLPILGGREVDAVARGEDGAFAVRTQHEVHRAHHVCLALGRRGTPRQLGVPGEERTKVAYGLIDAQAYQGRRVLVVGGGDSAVEAALALADQPGNAVTLSYRKHAFFRIRSKNEARLQEAVAAGHIDVRFGSEVQRIEDDAVTLAVRSTDGSTHHERLANDDVFVLVGGNPPLPLLRAAGVSFDPAHHPPPRQPRATGSGWPLASLCGLLLAVVTLAFVLWHADYYALPMAARPTHDKHAWLRPGRNLGLTLGIASLLLVVVNLLYLLRRAGRAGFRFGSLRAWMTSHVLTGTLALSCALLHAAMAPRDTPGGHAFWALAVLVVTGVVGRYFYAYVPRAANGRELELAEVRREFEGAQAAWQTGASGAEAAFAAQARREVEALLERRHWRGSLPGRIAGLLFGQRDLARLLARLRVAAEAQDIPTGHVQQIAALARRGHRAALAAGHFEDLRALLATWRFAHRWVAALLVLLILVHLVNALVYGQMWDGGGT